MHFDKLLVPAGSEVIGKISSIDDVSVKTRTFSAMDDDFSPQRNVHVQLDELIMPDGNSLPIQTVVSPGCRNVAIRARKTNE